MARNPRDVIKRLKGAVQRHSKQNATLLETIAKQKQQIADRDLTIRSLKAQQKASTKQVRAAFATATEQPYLAAQLRQGAGHGAADIRTGARHQTDLAR